MGKTKRTRNRRLHTRDRRKTDSGGSVMQKVAAPFKWSWHHALIPDYVTGKLTGKGPSLKDSVNEEFTWKGIHNNKGGRRRRRRSRCRRRCCTHKRRTRDRCRRKCCTRKRRRH